SLAVGQTATDTFTYTAVDNHGTKSSSATVTITITGVNDTPVVVNDSGTIDEDHVLIVAANGVLANDSDPDAEVVLVVGNVNCSAANVGTQITLASGALLTVSADGSHSFNPALPFYSLAVGQTATDTFTYTAVDNHG